MATCSRASSRRSPTGAPTSTAARSATACAFRSRSSMRCAPRRARSGLRPAVARSIRRGEDVHAPGKPLMDHAKLGDEAIDLLRRYLMVDTTNPPGNEIAGARFLAEVLDGDGIASEIVES